MTETAIPTPDVVGIINFHGLTLWVVQHEAVEYVYAKPLSDLAGIDWRGAKKTLQDADNAHLYGSTWLKAPVFAAEGGTRTPRQDALCIRLDRARMFLARINTKFMRAKGANEAADRLLALQEEWAGVLHAYETHGVAVKDARLAHQRKTEQELAALIKTRNSANAQEKPALTRMIADKLTALGYPAEPNPQIGMDV